jgi:hypothetical protein
MHLVGGELFHADGRMVDAFHNLVNVPKNGNMFYSQKSVKELFQL